MQAGKLPEIQSDRRTPSAFTLLELLTATTSSTIILLAVFGLLAAASNAVSTSKRHEAILIESRAASAQLSRDLQCSTTGTFRNPQLPFEHNRISGTVFSPLDWSEAATLARATMNAASTDSGALHPDFDTLAFATHSHRNHHGEPGITLVAYYCAYTRDSPIVGDRASMKLFRHLRARATNRVSPDTYHQPAPATRDQARTSSLLAMLAVSLQRQADNGIRDNRNLPYLLLPVDAFRDHNGTVHRAIHIWPANFFSLPEPPPPATPDPEESLRDAQLRADHPLACNVLRFKATPLHRDAQGHWLGAAELNAGLRINREHPTEWPVLVMPDIIDIELTLIGPATAAHFRHRHDWLDWESNPSLAGLVQREAQTLRIRVAVGHNQT